MQLNEHRYFFCHLILKRQTMLVRTTKGFSGGQNIWTPQGVQV